jgi:dihydrofolate reductase
VRNLIVQFHSTANDIVSGPPSDPTNFMVWAQAGIEDSLESFLRSLANVDSILLGRATYEDLVRKWPKVKEWPDVSDIALRIGEKINTAQKIVVAGKQPIDNLTWGAFDADHRPACRTAD